MKATQSTTAVAANCPASFGGSGGKAPYTYLVLPNGPGGTINRTTGQYLGPARASSDPAKAYDVIQVTDAQGVSATARILVGTPLVLFCEVLQREMGLEPSRVYLWDQKINQPTDSGLYIAVSVPSCKPFANINRTINGTPQGLVQVQSINMIANVEVDIMSRGPEARDRKEEVLLAFNSIYAEQQQEANSFFIGKLQPGQQFVNLSNIDGAAIPYRYKILLRLQYMYTTTQTAQYYDNFRLPQTVTDNS